MQTCTLSTEHFQLKCSVSHLVLNSTTNLFVPVNSLNIGDCIDTVNGPQKVISI